MGEVRRVHDPALGRCVALKTLHAAHEKNPEAKARYAEEGLEVEAFGADVSDPEAAAAAVSGLHRKTRSSFTPERPSKLRGVVRSEFLPAAGDCPMPWHPLHPA